MSLMNQSESTSCDLLEQAIRDLNEMNNCVDTQQDPVLFENDTQEVEILDIFPPRVMKCEKGNQTESLTPPHVLRKMSEKKKINQQKNVMRTKRNIRRTNPSPSLKPISHSIFRKEIDTRMKKTQNNKVSFKGDPEVISDHLCEIPPRSFNPFMAIDDLDQEGTVSDWNNSSVIIKMHSLKTVMVNGGDMIVTPVDIVLFDNPKWARCFYEKNLTMMYSISNEINTPYISVIYRSGTFSSLAEGRHVNTQIVNNTSQPFMIKIGDVIAHMHFFAVPIPENIT